MPFQTSASKMLPTDTVRLIVENEFQNGSFGLTFPEHSSMRKQCHGKGRSK